MGGKQRGVHRWLVPAAVVIVLFDGVLLLTGVLAPRQALVLFLAVELPLGTISALLAGREFRALRRTGHDYRTAWAGAVGSWVVDGVEREAGAFRAIALVALGRRSPAGMPHLPYGKGLAGTAAAFAAVTVIETVVLHLLVPVAWVRALLLVVSVYAFVVVLGLVLARIAFPHHIDGDHLQLRQGVQRVVRIPLADISAVAARRRIDVVGLFPSVRDDRLRLPSQDGTCLDLDLHREVQVRTGLPRRLRRQHPNGVPVRSVSLHVDDPAAAAATLAAEQQRVAGHP